MKLAYFVHDLHDSAVARRVKMLRAAGAEPTVIGFRRLDSVPETLEGAPVIDLGRTHDAQMAQRAGAVVRNLLRAGPLLDAARGADVIIGRNLEALALAWRARSAAPKARLVYECLDIHRLLLGSSLPARMIQRAEGALLSQVDQVIVSSPAFARDYFGNRPSLKAPVMLVENKLLTLDRAAPVPLPAPQGPPWTIAWFGMLRCRRTFATLAELVTRHAGKLQVSIAGRASPAEFPDFEAEVAKVPGFTYHGPYRPEDLPALYAPCHFAWAIDWFEEGLNSRWLLPNRLYEATSFGVVPIALKSVETGKWLDRHQAGVTLGDGLEGLDALIDGLDGERYAALRGGVSAIPRTDLIATKADCDALVAALAGER